VCINVIGEKRATGQGAPQPSRVANAGLITSTQTQPEMPTCIPKEGLVYVFPIQPECQIVTARIPTIKLKPNFNELASKLF
jgi:hypothetical protein